MSGELVRYDAMCQSIAEAYGVDEAKTIRDKALAIEIYARQARNTEAETKACEIRLRAERRCGQLLREREMAKGAQGNPGGQGAAIVRSHGETAQTLADIGLSKTQSSRFQKLADIPEDQFGAGLAASGRPTTTGLIASAERAKPAGFVPAEPRALWLCDSEQRRSSMGMVRAICERDRVGTREAELKF